MELSGAIVKFNSQDISMDVKGYYDLVLLRPVMNFEDNIV